MPIERRRLFLLALICLGIAAFLPYIIGRKMTLNDLRKEFEDRKMKTSVCYYYGNICNLESQYCSSTTRTCETFLEMADEVTANIEKCRVLLTKNITELGKYDVCIYFLGSLDKDVIQEGGVTLEELRAQFENRTSMQVPCIYNGKQCKLDHQYCNATTRTCHNLFNDKASQKDKVEQCEDILERDDVEPGPADVCIYYLGTLRHREGAGLSVGWRTATIILVVILVIGVAITVYCLYSKQKLSCQRYQKPGDGNTDQTTGTGGPAGRNPNNREQDFEDVHSRRGAIGQGTNGEEQDTNGGGDDNEALLDSVRVTGNVSADSNSEEQNAHPQSEARHPDFQ